MDFLKNIGEAVNNAVDFVAEKNRKFTKINNLKRLIKKESDSIIKSYITLGKHYYKELRDVPDKDMQKICDSIDTSKLEIKKLKKNLFEVNNEQDYSKFRDLVEDEPLDLELSEECECNCACGDDCDCEAKFDKTEPCTCDCDDKIKEEVKEKSSSKNNIKNKNK